MLKWRNNDVQLQAVCVIFSILLLFLFSARGYCGEHYYYYLQVGSFQAVPKAKALAKELSEMNEIAIIRGEDITGLGYWYRVYLGPFSSLQEASQKQFELRKKGFFAEQAFVHKKTDLLESNVQETPEVVEAVEEAAPAAPEADRPPAEITADREKMKEEEPSAREVLKKHLGRNMDQGKLAIGLRHTSIEVNNEITSRKLITSNGTTTNTQEINLANINTTEFSTSMYFDNLHIRFGLTDYLEVFADIGAAYDKISDPKLCYGGGARLNLFQLNGQRLGDYYLALQGEYLAGELEEEYQGSAGANWSKEAEWSMVTARMEIGVVFSGFTGYIGGAYFVYSEDTDRVKLTDLPPATTQYILRDELEEEDSFGFYCGGAFHILPTVLVHIEGQIVNQTSIFGALEYHF